MKTLVCTAPGQLDYGEAEMPQVQNGQSLIQIKRIGVCGTDLHAYEGTQPYFTYPRILGHELAGIFVQGDAEGFVPGEAVTIIPYFNCGHCIACRAGKPNCCVQMQVCGVHRNGGMAEYLLVPSQALLHGQGLRLEELALVEPLAIGAHGVRRAGVQPGEFVVVIGAGPIGLGIMACAQSKGAVVIAMDVNAQRLSFCKNNLGIQHDINPATEDAITQLAAITNGDMPTVVLEATGNRHAINNGFAYMAHGGRYVLVGLQKEEICFSHPEFHKREGTLMSSRNSTRQDFEWVMNAMKSGRLNPTTFITHTVSFGQAKEAFPNWLDPTYGTIKAQIDMEA